MSDTEHWSQGTWGPDGKNVAAARRHLGFHLREAREYRKLTQPQAAAVAGLTPEQYVPIERGQKQLPQAAAEKLAAAWDLTPQDLRLNECMPAAPSDPVARLAFVRERNEAFRSGRVLYESPKKK